MHWDYVGNAWAVEMLRSQVLNGAVRHGYLFCGPPGIGRRTLALRFFQVLNCLHPTGPGIPCLQCLPCRQIQAMQYSDLLVVQIRDGRSEISKDQVRQAQQFLSLAPYQSPVKAVLILDFQSASAGTQDALLKVLEETPGEAMVLITVDDEQNLLPTTVSRCEVISLRPAPPDALAGELEVRDGLDREQAQLFASLSGGCYGLARAYSQDGNILTRRLAWLEQWESIRRMDRLQRFRWMDTMFPKRSRTPLKEKRLELGEMLSTWMSYQRDCMLLANAKSSRLMNIDRLPQLQGDARQVSAVESARLIRCLDEAVRRLDRYLNPRLVMENLMLDLEGG